MSSDSTFETFTKGELTRQAILREAVQVASERGLEGLSIGRLAEVTGMSKAGLFAHFGSKEDLQLAALKAARDLVAQEVFAPAFRAPRGLDRLVATCDRWLDHAERGIFRGGCPFAAASTEFDGRPGRVRDFVAECLLEVRQTMERLIREAQALGELSGAVNPTHLAFEFQALLLAANNGYQLYRDLEPIRTTRAILRERLQSNSEPGTRIDL